MSIGGWLECDRAQLNVIEKMVLSRKDCLRTGGWGFPPDPADTTGYAFYGGTIHPQSVRCFLDQLRDIARLPASADDEVRVQGYFLVDHKGVGKSEWQLHDGHVLISPTELDQRFTS